MKVDFAFLKENWRGTEYKVFEVQCEVPTVCDSRCHSQLLVVVGPLCFITSKVEKVFKHFVLSSAGNLYGDANFLYQQDLASRC